MPRASFRTHVLIRAAPEKVFRYVSDPSRHGEWTFDTVEIVTVESSSKVVGNRYTSTAQSHGLTFHGELVVTEYNPPTRFAFVAQDSTGRVEHLFTFHEDGGNTRVERRMQFTVSFLQWLGYLALVYPVRIPSARKTLTRLKTRLEELNYE